MPRSFTTSGFMAAYGDTFSSVPPIASAARLGLTNYARARYMDCNVQYFSVSASRPHKLGHPYTTMYVTNLPVDSSSPKAVRRGHSSNAISLYIARLPPVNPLPLPEAAWQHGIDATRSIPGVSPRLCCYYTLISLLPKTSLSLALLFAAFVPSLYSFNRGVTVFESSIAPCDDSSPISAVATDLTEIDTVSLG
jgi:hypothetical protein